MGFGIWRKEIQIGVDEKKCNLTSAPLRNTAGYISIWLDCIKFKADNPGVWAFHCHIEPHLHIGMGVMFVEGVYKIRKIPTEALTCGAPAKMFLNNVHY